MPNLEEVRKLLIEWDKAMGCGCCEDHDTVCAVRKRLAEIFELNTDEFGHFIVGDNTDSEWEKRRYE